MLACHNNFAEEQLGLPITLGLPIPLKNQHNQIRSNFSHFLISTLYYYSVSRMRYFTVYTMACKSQVILLTLIIHAITMYRYLIFPFCKMALLCFHNLIT